MTPTLTSTDPALKTFADLVGPSQPISVAGGRTRWHTGGPLAPGSNVVSAPTGIVDYQPEEMTIQVRAGTPVAELDAILAADAQRCALPDRGGTVGGALAVGENDLRALGRGLLRNAVLQVRYVSAEGRIISGGGPTVKNVTGFDLPRLMVGSLGTLGLLAEVILRTNPIPAVSRWLRSDDADPAATLRAVLAPSAVLWDGSSTWIQIEGHGVDVDAAQGDLSAVGSFIEVEGPPELPPNRWSLPPAEALAVSHDRCGSFVAAAGLGLVWAERPAPSQTLSPAVTGLTQRIKTNFDPTGRLNPGRQPQNA